MKSLFVNHIRACTCVYIYIYFDPRIDEIIRYVTLFLRFAYFALKARFESIDYYSLAKFLDSLSTRDRSFHRD